MIGQMEQTVVKVNKSIGSELFNFVVPTPATGFKPIFIIDFEFNELDIKKSLIKITFNSDLVDESNDFEIMREYKLNDDGACILDKEEFGDYFIDGEISSLEFNPILGEGKCFFRINFGNNAISLHFIKGSFSLHKSLKY